MSWIQTISQAIEKAFSTIRPVLPSIPPILLLCEITNRSGLSAIALTSAIIKRLPEAGIEIGVNPDGSPNKINQFIRIISEEIIKEFKDNASVDCVVSPGGVVSFGVGANAGGPVTIVSNSTLPIPIKGIVR